MHNGRAKLLSNESYMKPRMNNHTTALIFTCNVGPQPRFSLSSFSNATYSSLTNPES